MNCKLMKEFESLGISINDWEISNYESKSPGNQLNDEWRKTDENWEWVLNTSISIIEESEKDIGTLVSDYDGKAIAGLSDICSLYGEYVLAKDLAIVASSVANSQNILSFDLDVYIQLRIYRGRYIACVDYFQNQLSLSSYDETFVHDIIELLTVIDESYQKILEIEPKNFDEKIEQYWALSSILGVAQLICRGTFLQLESGLGIISISAANKFILDFSPHFANISLRYTGPEFEQKTFSLNIIHHYMTAYGALMIRNLTTSEVPDEFLLHNLNAACMDGTELDPLDMFQTLFAHLIRLRVIAGSGIYGSTWNNAVFNAKITIEKTKTHPNYQNYKASYDAITSLINTGEIDDLKNYTNDHSRFWGFN